MQRTACWLIVTIVVLGCEPSKPTPPKAGSNTETPKPAPQTVEPVKPPVDMTEDHAEPSAEPEAATEPEPSSQATESDSNVPPPPALPEDGSDENNKAAAADSQSSSSTPTVVKLPPSDLAAGWIQLFDGETLFGWKPNSELNWRVEDGVIMADEGKPGLLQTTSRFANFELFCDFRVAKGGNSGIFLRSAFEPTDPAVDCYELNMCDTHPAFKSGSLVKRAQPTKEITADGKWHTFWVLASGPQIVVGFDGEPILDYTDDSEKPLAIGHIGLQMNGGKAEFKNVFLKPLGVEKLFNGQDLTGWREVPGSQSKFEVAWSGGEVNQIPGIGDGMIRVTGGRGFLETEATAKNFILQFEAKTNGDKLNSGIFFRAMPGTEKDPSNGYEFQIQNGFKDGDRTKPDDAGTGAIFRRAAARKVVSNDREWFTATLIADGPHFATWVNGYPVVDWTDDRAADENPRKGLRLEAGHFSLQGHDPGTDLNFRNLWFDELPE